MRQLPLTLRYADCRRHHRSGPAQLIVMLVSEALRLPVLHIMGEMPNPAERD